MTKSGTKFEISEQWAETVAQQSLRIWEHNLINAEDIDRNIDLTQLGGLRPLFFTDRGLLSSMPSWNRRHERIDLAFDTPAIALTNTHELFTAANELYQDPQVRIVQQLRQRFHDPAIGNEAWILPATALVEVGQLTQ